MKNIIKFSIIGIVLAFSFGVFASIPAISNTFDGTVAAPLTALAWGTSGCGGCGDGGGGPVGGGEPPIIIQVPTCDSFTASPTSLPYGGGNVTLTWNTTDATGVGINQGVGWVSVDGSKTVFVNTTKTFTLTANGMNGGSDTCTVTVTVQPPVVQVPTCDSLSASPTSLPYGGGNVTLSWATTNATNVSINQGVGTVAVDGSTVVNVTATKTFTLTATNTAGSDTCTVTVTVGAQNMPVCDSFTASPSSLPYGGGQVTLTWNTTNATSVSINNGVGSVAVDGSTVVTVGNTITYTLTASNTAGSVNCTASVTVNGQNPSPSCDSFTASPTSFSGSATITLTWNTTNATNVSISNGIGSVSVDGSTTINVSNDTTFTLTASNGSNSTTCTVSVNESSGGGGGGSSSPRCDLDISDEKVKAGDTITLTWDTTRATEVTITDDKGNVIFTTDDYSSSEKKKYYDGEIDVKVFKDTKFTLLAERGSKDRKCTGSVEVEDSKITVITDREQPLVAGIALSKVPYTGFEAGPVLTSIFYTILALWALFVAYIVAIRRNSFFGFTLRTNDASLAAVAREDEFKKKVKMLAAKYSHQPF